MKLNRPSNAGIVQSGPYKGQNYNQVACDDWSEETPIPGWTFVQLRDASGSVCRELRESELGGRHNDGSSF
jgi:hypothetical protein